MFKKKKKRGNFLLALKQMVLTEWAVWWLEAKASILETGQPSGIATVMSGREKLSEQGRSRDPRPWMNKNTTVVVHSVSAGQMHSSTMVRPVPGLPQAVSTETGGEIVPAVNLRPQQTLRPLIESGAGERSSCRLPDDSEDGGLLFWNWIPHLGCRETAPWTDHYSSRLLASQSNPCN